MYTAHEGLPVKAHLKSTQHVPLGGTAINSVGEIQNKPADEAQKTLKMPEGSSQLPQSEASGVQSTGKNSLLSLRAGNGPAKKTGGRGKRQKLLKVAQVTHLTHNGTLAIGELSQLLTQGANILRSKSDAPAHLQQNVSGTIQ